MGAPAGDVAEKTLEGLWRNGRTGTMCALEQAKAWGFREAQRARGEEENLAEIARSVVKVGGGNPGRESPRTFFETVDNDPEWYPGKSYQVKHGPAPALNGTKRQCGAASAMADKKAGIEPTYRNTIAKCPQATLNPACVWFGVRDGAACFGQAPHTRARIPSTQPIIFFFRIGPLHTSPRKRTEQNAKSRHPNGSTTTRACL